MNRTVFTHDEPDPVSVVLRTRFNRFKSISGCDGLARETTPEHIEILAVHARKVGTGQFRRFVKMLKHQYDIICVWHVSNPMLDEILPRYGFSAETTIDEFGEVLTGYRWDRPKQT